MNLVQSILTKNPCYTAGRKIAVKGLMLHSVGCPQPNASVFIKNWNTPSHTTSCVHGFIDANTGTVYQTLPWNHRGWHGGGASNNTHIGVEMCEPDCITYTGGAKFTCTDVARAKSMVNRTYNSAVELFAYLCKMYNLNPLADGVIISHYEGAKRGIACNHGDPEHLWNGLGTGHTMNKFRRDVKACMNGVAVTQEPKEEPKITALKGILEVIHSDGVNIRTYPDTSSNVVAVGKKSNTFGVIGITSDKKWYKLANNLYMSADKSLVKFTDTSTTKTVVETKTTTINATVQANTGDSFTRLKIERVDGGVFAIRDSANNFYLSADSNKADANVSFRKELNGDFSKWNVLKVTDGFADYTLLSPACNTDLFVSVQDNGIGSNNLKLYTALNNSKQRFFVRKESDGTYILIHAYTGKVISCKE